MSPSLAYARGSGTDLAWLDLGQFVFSPMITAQGYQDICRLMAAPRFC